MNRRERTYDQLLVLRCQEGDAAAFDELVGRWQERLWRHAWRLTGDEEAAWDALQEAWMGISRGIGRLEDAAAFHTWAYRIVSNRCRDWIRRERRRRGAKESYMEEMERHQEAFRNEERRYGDLKEAMKSLPGQDRAALSLRYEHGFDTAEIAEIIGIPEGTVKSRLHYARKSLRGMMKEKGNA